MKIKSLSIILLISIILVSCKNDKKQIEPEVVTVETTKVKKEYISAKMEAEFNDPKVAVIFEEYIQLKTALVNTSGENTAAVARSLQAKLIAIDVSEELTKTVQSIAESTDVEIQREAFVDLTAGIEKMLEGALKSGTVYKQYCPMAFGNTGAHWLSNTKEIQNPYFGDKMLKCGRVDAEIK
ncbi:MAG: PBP1b-binding outer membrane lipoprotein LpoB [Flavobacteriaceae bacterium]|jgi:PBP1b-binding outer membrane lipoprotein LpoB